MKELEYVILINTIDEVKNPFNVGDPISYVVITGCTLTRSEGIRSSKGKHIITFPVDHRMFSRMSTPIRKLSIILKYMISTTYLEDMSTAIPHRKMFGEILENIFKSKRVWFNNLFYSLDEFDQHEDTVLSWCNNAYILKVKEPYEQ